MFRVPPNEVKQHRRHRRHAMERRPLWGQGPERGRRYLSTGDPSGVAIERKIRLPEVERRGGLLKQMLAGFEVR